MTFSDAFVAVSRLLCDIMKSQEPFGRKVILLCAAFSPGSASDFMKIKVLDNSKLFEKKKKKILFGLISQN